MGIYKPKRRTAEGQEEIKLPISSVDISLIDLQSTSDASIGESGISVLRDGVISGSFPLTNPPQIQTLFIDKIPIIAGENVTFEVANNGQCVKISATGGEIDTSNLATVDKVKSISTKGIGRSGILLNDGLQWNDTLSAFDGEQFLGKQIVNSDIIKHVPIVAGDNVTFTVDEENQVVKINSTGGGTSNAILQVEVSTDPATLMQAILTAIQDAGGTATSVALVNLSGYSYGQYLMQFGNYGGNTYFANCVDIFTGERIYNSQTGNVFDITAKTVKEFLEEGKPSAKLPQIRYANCKAIKDEDDNVISYRFTVENLGGGELTWGDKLQICCRRKFTGGKMKLRKMAEVELTYDDFNSRFIKIEVDPNDEYVQKWLFRNDRIGNSTISQIHFRLKRVTKWNDETGEECNAIFSNAETVWKTYIINDDFDCGYDLASLKIK